MSPQPAKPSKPKAPKAPSIDRGRGTLVSDTSTVTGWLVIDKSGLWVHVTENVTEGTQSNVVSVPTRRVYSITWEAPTTDETDNSETT
jgi:hypothetical protein